MRRLTSIHPLALMAMMLDTGPCANCTCHRRNERPSDMDSDNDARSGTRHFLLLGEQGGVLIIMTKGNGYNDELGDGTFDRGRDFMSMFGDPTAHFDDMHDHGSGGRFHGFDLRRHDGSLIDDAQPDIATLIAISPADTHDDPGINRTRHQGSIAMTALDDTGQHHHDDDPGAHRRRHDGSPAMFALDSAGHHNRDNDLLQRLGILDSSGAWAMSDHPPAIEADDDVDPALVRFNSTIANVADAGLLVTA